MTAPGGLLEYFVLEAGDYLEQLDGALIVPGSGTPDPEMIAHCARAIRGSATMSRQTAIADVAAAIERVGRAVRDGLLLWDPGLRGVVTAAVDDLKVLLHNVRAWTAADQQRAERAAAELARYAPPTQRAPSSPTGFSGTGFLVAEIVAIADALDLFALRPVDRNAFHQGIARVRALRGIAALRDLPPLPEVVDELDRGARPVELADTVPPPPRLALFAAASKLLRRAASEMRVLGRPEVNSPELDEFAAAVRAVADGEGDADRIVPIADLFPGDGMGGVVTAAPHPPTTPGERFRLEVVSQAEHLRRLVADARQARDPVTRERMGRELRGALRALSAAAEGFGEHAVARYVATTSAAATLLEPAALDAVDRVARLLADPRTGPGDLAGAIAPSAVPQAHAAAAAPRGGRARTPTGAHLHALLETGIASIGRLVDRPLTPPVALVDATLVPIETLVYSGRRALDRARAVREEVRQRGGAASPDEIAELFDLVELAAAD